MRHVQLIAISGASLMPLPALQLPFIVSAPPQQYSSADLSRLYWFRVVRVDRRSPDRCWTSGTAHRYGLLVSCP
jgi:hypothetical protein